MKIKPKELLVNLPIVLTFQTSDEITIFAVNINSLIHGKVKVKYEELGMLGPNHMGLFYLQRNNEYQELREEFITLIEQDELERNSQL